MQRVKVSVQSQIPRIREGAMLQKHEHTQIKQIQYFR